MQTRLPSLDAAPAATDRGLSTFFLLTFAITWGLQFPAALAHVGILPGGADQYGALVGVGLFGPIIAATVAAHREGGRAAVRALFGQLRNWNAAPFWYPIALLLPGAVLALGLALSDPLVDRPWFYPPNTAPTLAALVLLPFIEEIGWRGFAQPRLMQKYGALGASAVLGFVWALWHTMMFVLQGFTPAMFALSVPFFIGGSIVFTWIYLRPGGGLPLVILMHAGAHLSNAHQSLPGDIAPFIAQTVGYCLLAAMIVLGDRKAWRLGTGRPNLGP
jgi:membrane protease YdiL (CAAX protease family)